MNGHESNLPAEESGTKRRISIPAAIAVLGVFTVAVLLATDVFGLWGKNAELHPAFEYRHEAPSKYAPYQKGQAGGQIYEYREIGAAYPTGDAVMTYGEFALEANGTIQYIAPQNVHQAEAFTGSREDVSARSLWTPFIADAGASLSFWKAANFRLEHPSANYELPDTVAWTLRLYNAETGARLATLDSTVMFRKVRGRYFPNTVGFAGHRMHEKKTIALGEFLPPDAAKCRVFLHAEVDAIHGNSERFFLADAYTRGMKYSELPEFSAPAADPPADNLYSGLYKLKTEPNPVQVGRSMAIVVDAAKDFTGRVLIIDGKGEIIHEVRSGHFAEDAHLFTYTPEASIPTGRYMLVLADTTNFITEVLPVDIANPDIPRKEGEEMATACYR
ncbi:MAG: hypothetical protein CL946_05945 [Ectothiorhodospiraceae bacterium]|nr:hypothetical protein [Ectothiorhodospiraceae bacterium]